MPQPPTTPPATDGRIERIEAGTALHETSKSLLAHCHAIRRVVFVDEQAVSSDLEWDGFDEVAEHFVFFDGPAASARALGTARMRFLRADAKVERVAVLAEARGRGIGRLLMSAAEASARAKGQTRLRLNAQVSALPFYERIGYSPYGDLFEEAGIDHRAMSKDLA